MPTSAADAAAGAVPAAAAPAEPAAFGSAFGDADAAAERLDGLAHDFDRDGFVVVRAALLPAHVDRLLALIDRMRPQLMASPLRKRSDVMDGGRPVPGLDVRGMVLQRDADAFAAGGAFPFLHLLDHPGAFPAAVRCLGNPNISLLTSHLIVSPPRPVGSARNIGWHTDGGTPHFASLSGGVRPFQQLKIGYYLVDLLEPGMGNLMVVPGSHKRPAIAHNPADDADPEGAVELLVGRGDAVIFQEGLWHAGGFNTSLQDRVALYLGYGARYLRPMDFFAPMVPAELLEQCTPIQRQLLGSTSTALGYYVPQPVDVPLAQAYRNLFGATHHRL